MPAGAHHPVPVEAGCGWRCAKCGRAPAATGGIGRFLFGPCGARPPGMVWERRLHIAVTLACGRSACGRCGRLFVGDAPEVWVQRLCPARWLGGLADVDPPDWGAWLVRCVGHAPGPPAWVVGAGAAVGGGPAVSPPVGSGGSAGGGVQLRLGARLSLGRPGAAPVVEAPAPPAPRAARGSLGGRQVLLPWAPVGGAGGPACGPARAAAACLPRGRVRTRPLGVASASPPARAVRARVRPRGGEPGGAAPRPGSPAGEPGPAPVGAGAPAVPRARARERSRSRPAGPGPPGSVVAVPPPGASPGPAASPVGRRRPADAVAGGPQVPGDDARGRDPEGAGGGTLPTRAGGGYKSLEGSG